MINIFGITIMSKKKYTEINGIKECMNRMSLDMKEIKKEMVRINNRIDKFYEPKK